MPRYRLRFELEILASSQNPALCSPWSAVWKTLERQSTQRQPFVSCQNVNQFAAYKHMRAASSGHPSVACCRTIRRLRLKSRNGNLDRVSTGSVATWSVLSMRDFLTILDFYV